MNKEEFHFKDVAHIFSLIESEDISKITKCTQNLIDHLQSLISEWEKRNKEIEIWEYPRLTLLKKMMHHTLSICHLANGVEVNHLNEKESETIIDIASVFILARSVIETYLTFEYLYRVDISHEERILRYNLWRISGFISRQNYQTPESPENRQKKDFEKRIISKLQEELEADESYLLLSRDQRKKLNKHGLPRLKSWSSLISEGALNSKSFLDIYKLYSNYTHSELVSIMQLRQSDLNKSSKDSLNQIRTTLFLMNQIVSLEILWIAENVEIVREAYESFGPAVIREISFWRYISSRL